MRNSYSILWIIVAVIVALILFFWLFPLIFGGNSNVSLILNSLASKGG